MNVSNISTASPTTWTIGKAIPLYTMKIHQDLGFGLGLNSTQGREAKHSKLASYVKNTTKGKRLRWRQVFKHDFMETIWLKEKNPRHITYRRGMLLKSRNQKQLKRTNLSLPTVKRTLSVIVDCQSQVTCLTVKYAFQKCSIE